MAPRGLEPTWTSRTTPAVTTYTLNKGKDAENTNEEARGRGRKLPVPSLAADRGEPDLTKDRKKLNVEAETGTGIKYGATCNQAKLIPDVIVKKSVMMIKGAIVACTPIHKSGRG